MRTWLPELVVMVDWSAASTVGPTKPARDRCWLASGRIGAGQHPVLTYCRTRSDCVRHIEDLLARHGGPALIGVDFPIGYPRDERGTDVLPVGRALVDFVAARIVDRDDGTNNRFVIAAALNVAIRKVTGCAEGPFWGLPSGMTIAGLTALKPKDPGVRDYRQVEQLLRCRGRNIQSAWKLWGSGSVGSQALLGLGAVGRILQTAGQRGRLWPFEVPDCADAVVVAEIWPSLCDFNDPRYASLPVRDARQVAAIWDWADGDPQSLRTTLSAPPATAAEGWILGVS